MDPKVKIAFFCGWDRKFLPDIVDHFSERTQEYEVRMFQSKSVKDFEDTMAWSHISWFEWCDHLLIEASKLPKMCRIVCRIHRYEVFTEMPAQVDWEKVDTLITVAQHITDTLKMRIPDIEDRVNVQLIYNGVNPKRFTYRKREKGFNIAYIGYLNFRKNPSLLIQCMRNLVDKDPRYVLHVAGSVRDMECKLYLDQMVEGLGLRDNIVFHGWIDDMNGWLEDKHFVLSTSIHEGCPYGIMEGMATGMKPLIHNFFAAEELYPRKYIFNTLDEFVDMVTSDKYNPAEYAKYIEDNYSLKRQLNQVESVFKQLWKMELTTENR
jgi:glycosyltransferase involved in cell wall biosynthesis